MKYIDIHSLPNIAKEYNQDMHMFLTHMCMRHPEYKRVATECEGFKILDNSLIELGTAIDPTFVIATAKDIKADEVVLPDVFCDGFGTMVKIQETIDQFEKELPGVQLMGVVQGKNEEDWFNCLNYILNEKRITTIGIPKICAKMHPQGRRYFTDLIINSGTAKHIHLLGLWYTYQEFNLWPFDYFERVRSVDTIMEEWFDIVQSPIRPDGWTIDVETGEVIHK